MNAQATKKPARKPAAKPANPQAQQVQPTVQESVDVPSVAASTEAPAQETGILQTGNGKPDLNGESRLATETETLRNEAVEALDRANQAKGRASNVILYTMLHVAYKSPKSLAGKAVRALRFDTTKNVFPPITKEIKNAIKADLWHMVDAEGKPTEAFVKRCESLSDGPEYFIKQFDNIVGQYAPLLGRILALKDGSHPEYGDTVDYGCELIDGTLYVPWTCAAMRAAVKLQEEAAKTAKREADRQDAIAHLTTRSITFDRVESPLKKTIPAATVIANALQWGESLFKEHASTDETSPPRQSAPGLLASADFGKAAQKIADSKSIAHDDIAVLAASAANLFEHGAAGKFGWTRKSHYAQAFINLGYALGVYTLDDDGNYVLDIEQHAAILKEFNEHMQSELLKQETDKVVAAKSVVYERDQMLSALALDIHERKGSNSEWRNRFVRIMDLAANDSALKAWETFKKDTVPQLLKAHYTKLVRDEHETDSELETTPLIEVADLINQAA